MNSGTVLAGTDGGAAMRMGPRRKPAACARSRVGWELGLGQSDEMDAVGKEVSGSGCAPVVARTTDAGGRVAVEDWRAKPLRQPLTHQARDDVIRTAWSKADHNAHRPRWIGLR